MVSTFVVDRITIWELSGLPLHIKHVYVNVLENPLPLFPSFRNRTLNFELLRINRIEDEDLILLGLKCFIQTCLSKLKCLVITKCNQRILNVICDCHWRNLHTLEITYIDVVYFAPNPENFPKLSRIKIQSRPYYDDDGRLVHRSTNDVFKNLFKHTRERKQLAVTTFLVMRHFFPAELAFIIADEVAFGPQPK